MGYQLRNKNVLITGGTGTWGQEFTRQLLNRGVAQIQIYSRGEYRQVEMRRTFQNHPEVNYVLGDVRDRERLLAVTRGCDVIIHLAALKHVPIVEEFPREATATNIIGSQNVIDAADVNSVDRVLYVSSDKAVDPLNYYGITKLAVERLMETANLEIPNTCFITYRAGNVMGSAGSVVPIFQETLTRDNSIKLTDPNMTRFFLRKSEVVYNACQSLELGIGREIFIPKMKSTTLRMLSQVMIDRLSTGDPKIEIIGIRPGEKLHELLINHHEAVRTRELENMWVVVPPFSSQELEDHYADAEKVDFVEYTSESADRFERKDLEQLLEQESFLSLPGPGKDAQLYFKKDDFDYH